MPYSYKVAKDKLNEADMQRFLCVYLNCVPTEINWEKATSDYGAASVSSMRVMVNAALRKIKVDGDGAGDEEAADETTPKAKTKSGGKRKSVAGMQEETPKKRGRKSKKDDQDSPIPDLEGANGMIKTEEEGEEED